MNKRSEMIAIIVNELQLASESADPHYTAGIIADRILLLEAWEAVDALSVATRTAFGQQLTARRSE